jgi:hypothetical protein
MNARPLPLRTEGHGQAVPVREVASVVPAHRESRLTPSRAAVLRRGPSFELRGGLIDYLTCDLLGPWGEPDETLEGQSPSGRYLVGLLGPKALRPQVPGDPEDPGDNPDDGPSQAGAEDPELPDKTPPVDAGRIWASSMGLAFTLAPRPTRSTSPQNGATTRRPCPRRRRQGTPQLAARLHLAHRRGPDRRRPPDHPADRRPPVTRPASCSTSRPAAAAAAPSSTAASSTGSANPATTPTRPGSSSPD